MENKTNGRQITVLGRIIYTNIFTPARPYNEPNGDLRYSLTLLIPKTDKAAIKEIVNAINSANNEAIHSKRVTLEQIKSNKFHQAVKDGDKFESDNPIYKGMLVINVKRAVITTPDGLEVKPAIYVKNVNGVRVAATPEQVYSGCWAYVKLDFFTYNNKSVGNIVSFSSVMKYQDDDMVGVGNIDDSDFDDLDVKYTASACPSNSIPTNTSYGANDNDITSQLTDNSNSASSGIELDEDNLPF